MNEHTIVTAFYNIREMEENHVSNRKVEDFLELAKNFILQLPYPLVIYIDTSSGADSIYEFIQQNRPYPEKTLIVRESFKDTYFYKDIERIAELQKTYPIYNAILQHETPNYIVLNNNKFWWLEQTISKNPFSSERFLWMDFSINHVAKNPETIHTWFSSIPKKIKQMCINPLVETNDYKEIFHIIHHHYAGGLFSGNAEYLLKYSDAFKKTTQKIYDEQWYQIDEAVMTIVHNENPEWFDDFYGDYNGIIMNYNEPLDYNEPWKSWSCIYRGGDKCINHSNYDNAQKLLDYIEREITNQANPIFINFQLCYFINNNLICNWYTNNKKIKKSVIDLINREIQKNNQHIKNIVQTNQEIERYENKSEILSI
jgi:hypothetical protein